MFWPNHTAILGPKGTEDRSCALPEQTVPLDLHSETAVEMVFSAHSEC